MDSVSFEAPLQPPFIPPFEYVKGGMNPNLRADVSLQLVPGPDEHGYIGATFEYAEESDVKFHHAKTTNFYDASGYGTYTDVVINGFGVPFKSIQGVQVLWNHFFATYMNISQEDWQTHSDYYHYVFGKYLHSFIFDFCLNLDVIVNITQSDIDNVNSLNEEALTDPSKESMQGVISNLEFTMPDYTYLTEGSAKQACETILSKVPISYSNLAAWFLGIDSDPSTTMYTMESDSFLTKTFDLFAKAADIEQRSRATLDWAYNYLIKMLDVLTLLASSQSNRVSVLTKAQEAATSDMADVTFTTYDSTKDVEAVTANERRQGYVQVYQGVKSLMVNYQNQQSSVTQNTNNAYNDVSDLVNDFLTTLNTLVINIFKAGG